MVRRWTKRALTAVIVAIVVAASVSGGSGPVRLSFAPLSIELIAPVQTARIVFTF